jgi:hypothetical protein
MRNRHGYLVLGLVLILVSLAAAGCGGGSSPSVASLGDGPTTTISGAGGAPGGGGPSSSSSGGPGQAMAIAGGNALKFAHCMRAHGVAKFPDPNSQGVIELGASSGINPSSATFQAAQQSCRKLVGGDTVPALSSAQQAKARRQPLAFSSCMRKHGVPDFPDPTFSGGGIGVRINGKPGSDLNLNSPTFQAAQQACQGLLPFKRVHSSSSSGGGK